MTTRLTRQQAINAKCRDCICDPSNGGGTWREQAAGCSSTSCPLFALRPLPRYASGAAATRWRDPVHVRQFAQHQPEAFRAALRNDCGATGEAV